MRNFRRNRPEQPPESAPRPYPMIRNILICTDGSSYGQVCCQYGAWIATRTEASLQVLYVTDLRQFEVPLVADLSGSLGIQPYQDIISELQKIENRKAEIIEDGARRALKEVGFEGEMTFSHRTGLLVDTLGEFEDEVDLVLLGKRGENADFATEHLGSNMERMIRATRKPCLVTSRQYKPFTRAALAFDGSASTRRALEFVCASNLFRELPVRLVTVVEGEDRDLAEHRVREALELAERVGGSLQTVILEGEVEEAIADYVEREEIDMLLMGAYGHSRIRRLLIGSSTTDLIRSCRIPVLCFR